MSLAEKIWEHATIHDVALEWLRAERGTNLASVLAQFPRELLASGLATLLDRPDLSNADENRARLRLLYMIQSLFVIEIPPDTAWFRVKNLTDDDLSELYIVNYRDWNDPGDNNELRKVAVRKRLALKQQVSAWPNPILWGHDKSGPFTILEGNHRLAAYAFSGMSGINMPVLIGLSPIKSVWHMLDECQFLIQDLVRR
jgi:hypothetical protein